ncbi:hypothetical protein EVAR_82108_1 [Eumeta japonica]|uniref:Uncharacterized protein n=1 Tax=Eumeta variegata TaxID=151549 RepID=A0A4C1U1K7_EUMVA|nr:hypothetical protein EVAR_82108_1 [Eumeta japonica]
MSRGTNGTTFNKLPRLRRARVRHHMLVIGTRSPHLEARLARAGADKVPQESPIMRLTPACVRVSSYN